MDCKAKIEKCVRNVAPNLSIAKSENWYDHAATAHWFITMKRVQDLGTLLGLSYYALKGHVLDPVYASWHIPKKNGDKRQISSPSSELMEIQKKLNFCLQAGYIYLRPSPAHGFMPSMAGINFTPGILSNATPHVNKRHILNIDLKDFFPSISAKRVHKLFQESYRFENDLSIALTCLVTYNGSLPAGAPTSPIISNLICIDLDHALEAYAIAHKLTYTRYADDLTFSSDKVIGKDVLLAIQYFIEQHGFQVNHKKVHYSSRNHRQSVTGIVVNEKPNVNRPFLKKVRAMLHNAKHSGVKSAAARHFKTENADEGLCDLFMRKLNGYVGFIGHVRGKDDPMYIRFREAVILLEVKVY